VCPKKQKIRAEQEVTPSEPKKIERQAKMVQVPKIVDIMIELPEQNEDVPNVVYGKVVRSQWFLKRWFPENFGQEKLFLFVMLTEE